MLLTLTTLSVADFVTVGISLSPFGLILFLNELIDTKTNWPREYHRKFGHVLSGLAIITSTYFLSVGQLLLLATALIASALLTYLYQFNSVHGVSRKTIGTFLFPLSFLFLIILFGERQMELVRYGIWILTVPDALAALIGSQWGRQIPRFNKSLLGSGVFFLSLFILTILFTGSFIVALAVSIILTIIEFFSQWGTDNLCLPLAGTLLLILL